MTQLVTMEGNRRMGHEFSLLKLMGNDGEGLATINPWKLKDQEAGVQFLYQLAKQYPGITWGDLFRAAQTGADKPTVTMGWNPLKNLGRKMKNLTVDVINFTGDKAGDAIRLLTDKEVVSGLSQYGAAYATGGASMGAQGMFEGLFKPETAQKLLGAFGQQQKVNYASSGGVAGGFGNIPPMYLAIAGGAILILIIALK